MAPPRTRLFLRADAGLDVGAGHVMRCLALGQAWQTLGYGDVTLLSVSLPDAFAERARSEGFGIERVAANAPGSAEDVEGTLAAVGKAPVVLDGYAFGFELQRAVAARGPTVVMDDVVNRQRYVAHLLVNQNPHADASLYEGHAEGVTHLLLGLDYALLRREFQDVVAERSDAPPRRLLVSLGGGDHRDATSSVLLALRANPALAALETRVLVGASNPRRPRYEALAAGTSATLMAHQSDVARQMLWADVAVTGSGSILWECLHLALPTVAVVIADNQAPLAETLEQRGLLLAVDHRAAPNPGGIEAALRRLVDRPEPRATVHRDGPRVVDGAGAERVARALHELMR